MSEKKGLPPFRPDDGTRTDTRFEKSALFRIFAKNWSSKGPERPVFDISHTSDGRLGVSRVVIDEAKMKEREVSKEKKSEEKSEEKWNQEQLENIIELFLEEGELEEDLKIKYIKKGLSDEEFVAFIEALNKYLANKNLPLVRIV